MSNQALQLQIEIDRIRDQMTAQARVVQSAGSQCTLGAVGALAGVLLLVFVNGVWWLGLLLFLAGTLAVFTQGSRKRAAEREMRKLEERIEYYRQELSRELSKTS